jgi:hypothetical protein
MCLSHIFSNISVSLVSVWPTERNLGFILDSNISISNHISPFSVNCLLLIFMTLDGFDHNTAVISLSFLCNMDFTIATVSFLFFHTPQHSRPQIILRAAKLMLSSVHRYSHTSLLSYNLSTGSRKKLSALFQSHRPHSLILVCMLGSDAWWYKHFVLEMLQELDWPSRFNWNNGSIDEILKCDVVFCLYSGSQIRISYVRAAI